MYYSVNITKKSNGRSIHAQSCHEVDIMMINKRAQRLATEYGEPIVVSYTPQTQLFEFEPIPEPNINSWKPRGEIEVVENCHDGVPPQVVDPAACTSGG